MRCVTLIDTHAKPQQNIVKLNSMGCIVFYNIYLKSFSVQCVNIVTAFVPLKFHWILCCDSVCDYGWNNSQKHRIATDQLKPHWNTDLQFPYTLSREYRMVRNWYSQLLFTSQAGKLKFFGTRPNWVVSYIAYTKFHSPRPVFHLPGQISTRIGERASASFPAC